MARLAGNLAPVAADTTIFDLAVDGHVPEELTERFLRIGLSPIGIADPQRFRWFTGTGMAHGVRLGGGCAEWYRNRMAPHFSVRHPLRAPALGHREFGDHVDRHSRPAKHRIPDHDLARD